MKKITRSNIYFIIILLLQVFGSYGLAYLFAIMGLRDSRVALFISHMCLLIVPAIIYLVVTKSNIKETLRLNKLTLKNFFLVILIGILVIPLSTCLSAIAMMFFKNEIGSYIYSISSTNFIVLTLLIAVMPAITEEINMRGVILKGYDSTNIIKASIITGLMFGMLHINGHQLIGAAAIGFIMAYVVRITNSIFSSVIIHFITNFSSVVTLKSALAQSAGDVLAQADSFELTSLPFEQKMIILQIFAFVAICIGGLISILIKKLDNKSIENINCSVIVDGTRTVENEKVINFSFIACIIVYVLIVALKL